MVDVVVVVLLVVLIDRRAWDDCISAGWSFNVNSWGDFGKMVSLWWNQVTMVTMVVEVVKEAKNQVDHGDHGGGVGEGGQGQQCEASSL